MHQFPWNELAGDRSLVQENTQKNISNIGIFKWRENRPWLDKKGRPSNSVMDGLRFSLAGVLRVPYKAMPVLYLVCTRVQVGPPGMDIAVLAFDKVTVAGAFISIPAVPPIVFTSCDVTVKTLVV